MSKITMDNLSDNLKAYMDSLGLSEDQVVELIKNNISGDLEGLNTSDKSSLVAAINELFQSANNGKELIANAIGEPLNSSDTFSAMSTGINGLNSQFKSALMNNGVSIESTDKFKQLIEKLASLANSEGKGIQYAEGTYTNPSDKAISVSVDTNLGFTPSLFIVTIKGIHLQGINNVAPYGPRDMTLTTLCPTIGYTLVYDSGGINTDTKLTLTYDANSFSVSKGSTRYVYFTTNTTFNWYAIGVGEEDTTLEDSLRDILGNKGVEVTEEDDLASLIIKVDRLCMPSGNAVASDVANGKTFINNTGQIITGTASTYLSVLENGGDSSKYKYSKETFNSGTATLTHKDGYLNMHAYGSSYQTGKIYFNINEEFDLTDKTMVLFDLSISGNAHYVYYKFGVYEGTDNFTSDTTLVSYIMDDSDNSKDLTSLRAKYIVDVSSCTGTHKIGIYFAAYGSYAGDLNLYNIEIK